MAYSPDTWTPPIAISGTDQIAQTDEKLQAIVDSDANSIKNYLNAEMAKVATEVNSQTAVVEW